jgi:ribosomal protein L40E
MTKSPPLVDPGQERIQGTLCVFGLVLLGLGLVLTAIGLINFFTAFGTIQALRYLGAVVLGLPLIAIGAGLTRVGYSGEIMRDFSRGGTPGVRDAANPLAEFTPQGVETTARATVRGSATAEGESGPSEPWSIRCHRCQAPNPPNAKFCNQCGTTLEGGTCASCGAALAAGARFCNQCGQPIG